MYKADQILVCFFYDHSLFNIPYFISCFLQLILDLYKFVVLI